MSQRRLQIFHVVLFLFSAYAIYNYINREVLIRERSWNETEYHIVVRNPLLAVFIGRSEQGEGFYIHFTADDRLFRFSQLLLTGLYLVAVTRYFVSTRSKRQC